ncbi:sulfur oxidation c-type cytochrome SoxA [Pseudorhodoferax sp.]|uniref:sulfur oxidation c-type cytochrome SoxA n=1 Tax=Pseudorhodoferax sp. TaxID=1993553 RepID=UPI002DD67B18|nr:sulfur oxidation c-type cytochrome SoxA [Pseudorhodoferax sp.]
MKPPRLPAALLLLASLGLAADADTRRSGFADMSPATQALQRDETQNPALLWVRGGEAEWTTPAGVQQRSCAACHGAAERALRGVAARYPAFDAVAGKPLTLAGRINACRVRHQQMPAWAAESDSLLGLQALAARHARGAPIEAPADPRLTPWRMRGERLYSQRIGQLDLSCTQCHDQLAGRRLGGSVIPQGHPTAYPVYRLEWQALGSLQRRLRGCFAGVRADVPPWDADELLALELHLMQRAAGMPLEGPGVRP